MNDIRYLLSIKELLDDSAKEKLLEAAYAKLDRERAQKVKRISQARKCAQCIGAGLLLQLGLQELREKVTHSDRIVSEQEIPEACEEKDEFSERQVQCLTVSQILDKLDTPIEPEYTYGEKGKPYFKNFPVYFSLSHSGDYVFCVFSEQEVGADIQYKKPDDGERVVKRFFTEAERKAWENCADGKEREKLFGRLWTRKEAYGKLTGEGIVGAMAVNVLEDFAVAAENISGKEVSEKQMNSKTSDVFWQDIEMLEHYQISICKYAGEKE